MCLARGGVRSCSQRSAKADRSLPRYISRRFLPYLGGESFTPRHLWRFFFFLLSMFPLMSPLNFLRWQPINEDAQEQYDRQIRLWGEDVQKRMSGSCALFSGVNGVSKRCSARGNSENPSRVLVRAAVSFFYYTPAKCLELLSRSVHLSTGNRLSGGEKLCSFCSNRLILLVVFAGAL